VGSFRPRRRRWIDEPEGRFTMTSLHAHRAVRTTAVLLAAGLAMSVAACSGSSDAADKVAVVGYSVPQPAYDALEAAFQKTDAGKGVTFTSSFGASGSQSKAVAAGQKADYVAFSVEPDDDGSAVTIFTPGLTMSSQPETCSGLPLRVTITTTESDTLPFVAPVFHAASTLAGTRFWTSGSTEKAT
jgi:hypothetical protein